MGAADKDVFIRTRRRAARTITIPDEDAYRTHTARIGEIVYLWNALHDNLFMTFLNLFGLDEYETAHGVWHAVQSDKVQREMLKNAATARLKPRLRRLVHWVCKRQEKLSCYRNDFVHVSFYYAHEKQGYAPNDMTAKRAAVDRMSERDLDTLYTQLNGDLCALINYSDEIAYRVGHQRPAGPTPFLGKPVLKTP